MSEIGGKRVLVTGAGRGIGQSLAFAFAAAGAELVLVDVRAEAIASSAAELNAAGHRALALPCDLSRREAIDELVERVHREIGSIDVLVNNAGVVTGGRYDEIDRGADQRMLDVNVAAVHWLSKAFLPDLQERHGHLVQLASAAGFLGVPDAALYAASKWFVIGLSESILAECKLHGTPVGVTIVCPSYVGTGMFAGVKAPLLTRMLSPDALAEKVIRAVREDRLFVREPWLVKATPPLKALLPRGAFARVADLLGVSRSMLGWHGHGA